MEKICKFLLIYPEKIVQFRWRIVILNGEEIINKLKKILELRSETDIDLHVKDVEKGVPE